jgi:hypothetical protein
MSIGWDGGGVAAVKKRERTASSGVRVGSYESSGVARTTDYYHSPGNAKSRGYAKLFF